MSAARGFSLLEVVVVLGLMGLLTYLVMSLFLPSLRSSARASTRAQLQQQALLVTRWLYNDLNRSIPRGIGIRSAPTVLSLQPAADLSIDGAVVWQPTLVSYFLDSTHRTLYRRTWNAGNPPALGWTPVVTRPRRPTPTELSLLASQLDGSERSIATHVDQFELSHTGTGDNVDGPVELLLSLSQRAAGAPRPETYQVRRLFSLRLAE